ncbi:MAG: C45 family peptidase [Synechococcales bacterium]|nr:C45 family peptidase [Synechococcales bacterium]
MSHTPASLSNLQGCIFVHPTPALRRLAPTLLYYSWSRYYSGVQGLSKKMQQQWQARQIAHRQRWRRLALIPGLVGGMVWVLGMAPPAIARIGSLEDCREGAIAPELAPELAQPPVPTWQPASGTWQPVPPGREDTGIVKTVWLQGTSYEMGCQHGFLLHEEIAAMGREVIQALNFFGRALGLGRLSQRRSFPGVYDECRGMAAATTDIGFTVEGCMVLALGDVYQEYFSYLLPNILFNDGCAHFIVSGDATADGGFYQGWTIDNNGGPIDYWAENPTILVRQPNDGIPHIFITIPGAIWPNAGFNAEGIIVSNNTAHPLNYEDLSLYGRSTVQMMAEVTRYAHTFTEAYDIMAAHNRMRANLVIISDAKSGQAGVFELLGREMGVRELDENGLLYMTNHFLSPAVAGRDVVPDSSINRLRSFEQLLEPGGDRSRYGTFDPAGVVAVLRDRTNPNTGLPSPLDVADDDASIGGNGSHRQVVFDPLNLRFWIANGTVEPIPNNPFTCFSLGKLLGLPDAVACPAPAIE